MKINVAVKVLNLEGNAFKNGDNDQEDLTLKDVCIAGLSSTIPNENIDGAEKFKRYQLAQKIYSVDKFVTLTAEEVTKIKELVGKIYAIPVVGAVYNLLEKDETVKEDPPVDTSDEQSKN